MQAAASNYAHAISTFLAPKKVPGISGLIYARSTKAISPSFRDCYEPASPQKGRHLFSV
jgi:hypothetical protein